MIDQPQNGYSFTTPTVKARLVQLLALIAAAPDKRTRSSIAAEALGISQTVVCAYLNHLHGEGKIRPYPVGNRGGMEYGLGEDPELELGLGRYHKADARKIIRRKAADCKGLVPVDPMREFLFGHLSKIK